MDASAGPTFQKAPSLASELGDLVLELALALHKRAIYPPAHPLLRGAIDALLARARKALAARQSISLGVARHQLVIDGVATDETHPLLRELAEHLHEHELAAIRVMEGVTREELDDVVAALAVPAQRAERPLGALSLEELSRWNHVTLYPVSFDRLELVAGDDDEEERERRARGGELWLGLARAALMGSDVDDGHDCAPREVAGAIDRRAGERAYDQVVIGYLLQIASELTASPNGKANEALRKRVSQLVGSLRPETLRQLLSMGGDAQQRARFLMQAASVLSAGAVVDLVRASADLSRRTIARSMMRLLAKLARNAELGKKGSSASDRVLREQVQHLLADWTLDDPNPEGYSEVLSVVGRLEPGAAVDRHLDEPEPERIVEMSIETDTIGPASEAAVGRLVLRDGLGAVLDRLTSLPASGARETIIDSLVNGALLREHLAAERPDLRVLEHAALRLRERAVDPLLAAMAGREERDLVWLADLLVKVGPVAVPTLAARLRTAPALIARALLTVFEKLEMFPDAEELRDLARHEDTPLRREALRLMMKSESLREEAVVTGLRDPDERIVGLALASAVKACTPRVATALIRRLQEDDVLSSELRSRAIRALSASNLEEGMRWMVSRVLTQHWLFRYTKLRRVTPELVACVGGLAAHWEEHPEAALALLLARRSRDRDVRTAARARHAA